MIFRPDPQNFYRSPKVKKITKARGFTLIEAMIAVGVLALVLSLALPGYRAYVVRSNRTEALEALLAAAACQERIYTRANAYDTSACEGSTTNSLYTITVATSNGNQNFVATAAPQGNQSEDKCGSMAIDHTGAKTAAGYGGAFAQTCWSGKTATALPTS
ncbi:MAG: prepilin-type N-terminal cleavage/methylation domain-containing protein [Xanthomonadales bacterium]|nr:prepilin-type N-terminal cleavage/methylation domain-containing protein [Xanthomonadales bacterium]